jgi:hypothetical protein
VQGISQAVLGSSDELKVPAILSLFLKSEKIPALLYIRKGPEYTGPSPILQISTNRSKRVKCKSTTVENGELLCERGNFSRCHANVMLKYPWLGLLL